MLFSAYLFARWVVLHLFRLGILGFLLFGAGGLVLGTLADLALSYRTTRGLEPQSEKERTAYSADRALLEPIVAQLSDRLGIEPPAVIVVAPDSLFDEPATRGYPWRHRRARLYIGHYSIVTLPPQLLSGVLAHELGHLLPAQQRLLRFEQVTMLFIPVSLVALGLILGPQDLTIGVLIGVYCLGELAVLALGRHSETVSDETAVSLGLGAQFRSYLDYGRAQIPTPEPTLTWLRSHPGISARIAHIERQMRTSLTPVKPTPQAP